MAQLPQDTSVEAEYADGYIHSETFFSDQSPYVPMWEEVQADDGTWTWIQVGKNILNDIIEKRPEVHHGKLVRFSVFYQDQRYDVDFTTLPDNARPIRFRHGFMTLDNAGNEDRGWSGIQFGYQYNDDSGKNIQEVQEL